MLPVTLPKVLIADKDAVFWLASLVAATPLAEAEAIDIALTFEQCRRSLGAQTFGFLLLDVALLDQAPAGLAYLPKLRSLQPNMHVIILTDRDDTKTRLLTWELGADAFLPKSRATPARLAEIVAQLSHADARPLPLHGAGAENRDMKSADTAASRVPRVEAGGF